LAKRPSIAEAELHRLERSTERKENWSRWGPYLSERQWGTVREDYSDDGEAWQSFPHDHARSRVYRWGEDGLFGLTDRQGRICFSLALWNERDSILKERLFGLSGKEGNHGEDVKECYYYLDATPTYSYAKAQYKYPHAAYPYDDLVDENAARNALVGEYELADTGIFDQNRYFDVIMEYAKGGPNDVLIRITVSNRGPEAAPIHVLPQVWFRNSWSWGRTGEGYWNEPSLAQERVGLLALDHESLERFYLAAETSNLAETLFTDNESNQERYSDRPNESAYTKDAFHRYVVSNESQAVRSDGRGTKAAFRYRFEIPAGEEVVLSLRLSADSIRPDDFFGADFDETFAQRVAEANAFYDKKTPGQATDDERRVIRQAYAGLLWSKQFYHYSVQDWLEGDSTQPPVSPKRSAVRNQNWPHLYNRDLISMPDKWEYPWYAAWDLAFHMIPFAAIDPGFAKSQLVLFLREWYMNPSGQIPAYEWTFEDVNPPVHAWACWRVYKMTGPRGERDRVFLGRVFQKLLLNFTWWVNRKDPDGKNLFSGGFLGLDNIGVFDRSAPLSSGGHLEQADATAWMAFYCATMLSMALELASEDPAYEDVASKFFEHFVSITDAMNSLGGTGLWDEEDGFYYDQIHSDGENTKVKLRSMVGIIPLFACEILDDGVVDKLPGFAKRMRWFLENRPELGQRVSSKEGESGAAQRLLAIPSRDRLERVLRYVLDEEEFLSPFGVRSMSRVHADQPFTLRFDGKDHSVPYTPGESTTGLFGGNSNWRGPVWFPLNYLLIEALERYHHFYGDSFQVELPTGSGNLVNLQTVAEDLESRLSSLFVAGAGGRRPCHGDDLRYARDPHWNELILFYEYFHGETGAGLGASHQTGWTALAIPCLEDAIGARRSAAKTRDRLSSNS